MALRMVGNTGFRGIQRFCVDFLTDYGATAA
jgi:hypothetical protein